MSKFLLFAIPIIALLLPRIKPYGVLFTSFCTLIHEFSHAIVALILREKVLEIKINSDTSGGCVVKTKSKVKMFFISIVGYIMPSIIGYILLYYQNLGNYTFVFMLLVFLSIIALILYIRNTYGIVWIICFSFINILLCYVPYLVFLQKYVIYFYASLLLIENCFATLALIRWNLKSAKLSGDAYNLQKITHIPALLYSLLFFAFAVFMVYKSFFLVVN